jgi:basic membrane lipoprotein Med (substrate-binding protein (PBP1-ABC) superfamily)
MQFCSLVISGGNTMVKRAALMVVLLALMLMPTLAQEDGVFRVAVVAPSATDDLAFSQSMHDALLVMQEQYGEENFQFVFQDGTFVVDDAAVALRDWASSGDFDLVIAHGSQYGAILEELAPEFPEVSFAWGTDEDTFGLDNVFAYTAAAEEGGYINGVLAAQMTESGVIGVIGPIEVGDAKLYVDGFVAGATAGDPDVTVNVVYIQSFSDVPLATEAANTHVANRADVLTGTAQMVVGPIAVALEEGIPWFGTQTSQEELAAQSGMVFQVYKWEVVLQEIIDLINDGTLGGQSFTINLENGGLEMQISEMAFDGDEDAIAELQAQIDEMIEGIVSGDIVIFEDMEEEPAEESGS